MEEGQEREKEQSLGVKGHRVQVTCRGPSAVPGRYIGSWDPSARQALYGPHSRYRPEPGCNGLSLPRAQGCTQIPHACGCHTHMR